MTTQELYNKSVDAFLELSKEYYARGFLSSFSFYPAGFELHFSSNGGTVIDIRPTKKDGEELIMEMSVRENYVFRFPWKEFWSSSLKPLLSH